MRKFLIAAAFLAVVVAPLAAASRAQAENFWPADAKLYFIAPADHAEISGKTKVVFGLSGLGVAPAGVDKPKTGHHHLLIDVDAPSGAALNEPLPADANHRHFGGGQTETVLDLPPGKHTLQLIFADQNHVPHDPPLLSDKITIEVK